MRCDPHKETIIVSNEKEGSNSLTYSCYKIHSNLHIDCYLYFKDIPVADDICILDA